MLVIEHALQAFARYVALAPSVNRVTHGHVISGNGFGNSSRRRPHLEEPARHLLSGADLGKCAVKDRVEVDLERLLVRAQSWAFVVFHASIHRGPHVVSIGWTGHWFTKTLAGMFLILAGTPLWGPAGAGPLPAEPAPDPESP